MNFLIKIIQNNFGQILESSPSILGTRVVSELNVYGLKYWNNQAKDTIINNSNEKAC